MNRIGMIKIFAIVCFVFLAWIGYASAATFVVSKTFPACTSGDEYFTSIQSAVDRAEDGDTIVVCPGTYVENIVVVKSVDIHSYAGSSNTIIKAKNIEDNIITIIANDITISGFTIRNSKAVGIYLGYADGCNLSENNICSTEWGLYLFLSNNTKISYNTVNLNEVGIYLKYSNDNLIMNNTANANKQYHGIFLNSSNNNDIIDNNASNTFP